MCERGGDHCQALSLRLRDGLEIVLFGNRDHLEVKGKNKCSLSFTIFLAAHVTIGSQCSLHLIPELQRGSCPS